MRLRRWALCVSLLYFLTLVTLTWPLLKLLFISENDELGQVFSSPAYWVILAVLGVLQWSLLLARIEVHPQRPVARRPWLGVAITAAAAMALLVAGLAAAVLELITSQGLPEKWVGWSILAAGLAGWLGWSIVFLRYMRAQPHAALRRAVDWLLKGSCAELLVAVPAHVYARQQTYCCAGVNTGMGLCFGLAVLLLAFGPGVLLLFVARVRRLRRNQPRRKRLASHNSITDLQWGSDARDSLVMISISVCFTVALWLQPSFFSGVQAQALELVGWSSVFVLAAAAWFHALKALHRWQLGAAPALSILALLSLFLFAAVMVAS